MKTIPRNDDSSHESDTMSHELQSLKMPHDNKSQHVVPDFNYFYELTCMRQNVRLLIGNGLLDYQLLCMK